MGNAALSILGLVHSQCVNVSEGSFGQGLKPLWPARLSCIFAVLAQTPFSQGDSVEASLLGQDPEDSFFPLSDQVPCTPLLAFISTLSSPLTGTLFHGAKWTWGQASPSLVLASYTIAIVIKGFSGTSIWPAASTGYAKT